MLVLDCSVALAWCFRDEQSPAVIKIAHDIASHGAVVPSLWRLEIANGLQTAVRRGRIERAMRDQLLDLFAAYPLTVDSMINDFAWSSTLALSDKYSLSVYDAAYLELALRRGLPLASLDRALCQAAQAAGVPLVPL